MKETITIEKDFLEHLLACLANQKFIGDMNADGMAEGEEGVKRIQKRNQDTIDKAYEKGMDLLTTKE